MSPPKPSLDDLRIERAPKPDSSLRIGPLFIGLIFVVLAAAVIWWLNRPRPIEVRTVLVTEGAGSNGGAVRTVLNASGYVTARRAATVSSKVTGKVIEVLIEEGMRVEAGKVLARIDSSNVEASLHLAEAQLTAARSGLNEIKVRLEDAERELRRVT